MLNPQYVHLWKHEYERQLALGPTPASEGPALYPIVVGVLLVLLAACAVLTWAPW